MAREFLLAIRDAVLAKAPQALADRAFFGESLDRIADLAMSEWKKSMPTSQERRQGLEFLGQLQPDQERALIRAAAQGSADSPNLPLQAFLELVAARVRQALPLSLVALETGGDLIRFLPLRPPYFLCGDTVGPAGKYQLVRLLGMGGFGEVWLTSNQQAIKFFVGREAAAQAKHEVGFLQNIERRGGHPGIVARRDHDLNASPPYLVLDYIPDGDLGQWIRAAAMSPTEDHANQCLRLLHDLAGIVAFLHRPPIQQAHRDLKPANVLLQQTPSGPQLRLTDFGIAAVVSQQASGHTQTLRTLLAKQHPDNLGANTEMYASPESQKRATADLRDDIFSLGVIAYQMLVRDLTVKSSAGTKLKLERAGVPEPVRDLVLKCLCGEEKRIADAVALVRELAKLLGLGPNPGDRRTFGGIEFAWIPPGSFLMGSPETEKERLADREKQHRVTLTKGFYLGVYPITQAQWREVMGDNPSAFSRTGGNKERVKDVSDADLERFPVESVSWQMAQEFCARLSKKLGQKVELPSEAEWEYACRAGTTTPFHFGSVLNGTQANCDGNYPYGTAEKGPYLWRPTPVSMPGYPANAWGLHDLHGNVWEWCADAYVADNTQLGENDPLNDGNTNNSCVLRGGSWYEFARSCRAAYRSYNDPAFRHYDIGFRVALRLH